MTTDRLTTLGTDSSTSDLVVALLRDASSVSHLHASGVDLTSAHVAIADALSVHAHWDTTSSVAARAIVKGSMRRRHPELTDAALEALATHCTADFQR